MAGWYIRRGEKLVGPVELPKLQELVAAGRLLATDELAKDVTGPWKVAGLTTLFATPRPDTPPVGESTPSPLVPKGETLPVVIESSDPVESPTTGNSVIHVGQVIFSGIGRGMLATFGAVSRSMATRSQRKHEIKLAKIQAKALADSQRAIVHAPRHTESIAAHAPAVFSPQLKQTTVVQVVNKNKQSAYGCSGCGAILLLIILGLLALIGFGNSQRQPAPPISTAPIDATKSSDDVSLARPRPSAEVGSSQPSSAPTTTIPPIGATKTSDDIPIARPRPSAEVVRARLVPYTTPAGFRTKMVLVDWRNTGETVIRAVDANITIFDARGNQLEDSRTNEPIYAVSNNLAGVAPGTIYREPNDQGYILGSTGAAAARRVEVSITEVVERDAY
jgi:hypothetical protein